MCFWQPCSPGVDLQVYRCPQMEWATYSMCWRASSHQRTKWLRLCTRGNSCSAKRLGVARPAASTPRKYEFFKPYLHCITSPMELVTQVCWELLKRPAICICEHDAINSTHEWFDSWELQGCLHKERLMAAFFHPAAHALPTSWSTSLTVLCTRGLQATLLHYFIFY